VARRGTLVIRAPRPGTPGPGGLFSVAPHEAGPKAAAALDAGGNLATILQSLRSREDLQAALAHAADYTPTPLIAVDQLLFSFTLLAAPASDSVDELDAALAPEPSTNRSALSGCASGCTGSAGSPSTNEPIDNS
jgi:hypothetical protein